MELDLIPALTLSVIILPSSWGEERLPVRKCVVLLEVGRRKFSLCFPPMHQLLLETEHWFIP